VLPGFDAWFARACARELGERFQSARELATELRRVVIAAEGRELSLPDDSRGAFAATAVMQTPYVSVPPTASGLPVPTPPVKKSSSPALLLGAIGVLALVVAVAALLLRQRHPDAVPESASAAPAALPTAAPVELTPLTAAPATAAPATAAPATSHSVATAPSSPPPPVVVPIPASAAPVPTSTAAGVKAAPRPRPPATKREARPTPPAAATATATATAGKVNLGI
jgi:hypothetical protein